jgi:PhoPQ-activated pathogenicity-related protein
MNSVAFALALCGLVATSSRLHAGALEDYVARPDASYAWTIQSRQHTNGCTITRLEIVSQQWREHTWRHPMLVVRPDMVRNPAIAFLYITGDGRGASSLGILTTLAERAGAIAAVITQVPNQPLYDGRKEDALIAYTFDQYLKTGDGTWPLLFPMVKSAVRAMDAIRDFARREYDHRVESFVVGGASKRGWTTWLTAAADPRVKGIAPMVIDMLNMKAQTDWAQKVYGRQSEKIDDYVDLGLVNKLDTPEMLRLRGWVDPYSYRNRYTMPKLILLGTNDPYWTVDALRHYWNDLPEPKLIFQTPNAGHDLGGGKQALQSLAAFFQMIADGQRLPKLEWTFTDAGNGKAELSAKLDCPAKQILLWSADSSDRDLRDETWSNHELKITPGSSQATTQVLTPEHGYRAYLLEAVLTSPTGQEYRLSTEARVTPDGIR